MKVLKSGSGQSCWSVEATCSGKGNQGGGCGAELLVEEGDLYQTSSSDYGGDTEYYVTFTCPECGVETDLDKVPGNIKSRIPRKNQKKDYAPPPAQRDTPIRFLLGSGSEIKKGALQDAVDESQLHATVTGVKGADSGVNEQPLGEIEILTGAINRVLSAWQIDPQGEVYFSVENGIDLIAEDYIDYAIALMFIPKTGQIMWRKSVGVKFPREFVEQTAQKEGGFAKNTVGKTLQEVGVVALHDDPHRELALKSRREIIKKPLRELFDFLPHQI